jgi:plastocyanin
VQRTTAAGILLGVGLIWVQSTSAAHRQAATGSIEGRVIFDGTPPVPTVVQDGGSQPVLYVDRSGGVRYAVLFLPDWQPGGDRPSGTVVMNQRNFIFQPQVIAIRAGQTVRFTNDDPANHNVRTQDSNPANTFSINMGSGRIEPDTHRFAPTGVGRPLQLSCDIHPWMAAWVYVFDHQNFAVTNADGTFRIDNVPVGRHRIAVRQPSARLTRDLALDVRAGETTRLDVRFTSADIGMPSR